MLNQNDPETKAQIVYLSHGGGPLPILGDPGHKAMVDFMRQLAISVEEARSDPCHQRPLGRECRDAAGRTNALHVLRLLWFPGGSL